MSTTKSELTTFDSVNPEPKLQASLKESLNVNSAVSSSILRTPFEEVEGMLFDRSDRKSMLDTGSEGLELGS